MIVAQEFRRYLKLIWSWLWLILLGAIVAGGINYYLASKAPPKYTASTTLMIGQFIRQPNPDQLEVGITDRLATYYLELLRRQPVLDGVKQELKLTLSNEALAGMISSRVVPSTAFLEITVTDLEAERAVKLANTFARELIKQSPTAPENQRPEQRQFLQKQLDDLQVQIENGRKSLEELQKTLNNATTATEIAETRGKIKAMEAQIDGWQTNYTNLLRLSYNSSPNSISVLEESNQARRVSSVSPLISGAIAAAIGAVLALVFAIILQYLDDRIKSGEDIRNRLNLQVLGTVPRARRIKGQSSPLGVPGEKMAQAYEIACTNIVFSDKFESQRRSLLLTSTEKSEEQSLVSVNLAIAMLSFEQDVLMVDASNKPELHKLLGVENQAGFFEVFYGGLYLDQHEVVHETNIPNLYLMPAGNSSPDSQKLMVMKPGSQQIYNLPHRSLPGSFVIFNSDNVLDDKTTRLLSSQITGTVLLCELNRTRGQELRAAVEVIERLKGSVLGVITIERRRRWPFSIRMPLAGSRKGSKKGAATSAADSSADGGLPFDLKEAIITPAPHRATRTRPGQADPDAVSYTTVYATATVADSDSDLADFGSETALTNSDLIIRVAPKHKADAVEQPVPGPTNYPHREPEAEAAKPVIKPAQTASSNEEDLETEDEQDESGINPTLGEVATFKMGRTRRRRRSPRFQARGSANPKMSKQDDNTRPKSERF